MISKLMDLVSDGFSSAFGRIDSEIKRSLGMAKSEVEAILRKIERKFFIAALKLFFILSGIGLLAAGIILLLSRYFRPEYVLIVSGAILLYIGLIFHWIK